MKVAIETGLKQEVLSESRGELFTNQDGGGGSNTPDVGALHDGESSQDNLNLGLREKRDVDHRQSTIAPYVLRDPVGAALALTDNYRLHADASGWLTCQWELDLTPVTGATNPTLIITSAAAGDAGSYVCKFTNAVGTTETAAAAVTVT